MLESILQTNFSTNLRLERTWKNSIEFNIYDKNDWMYFQRSFKLFRKRKRWRIKFTFMHGPEILTTRNKSKSRSNWYGLNASSSNEPRMVKAIKRPIKNSSRAGTRHIEILIYRLRWVYLSSNKDINGWIIRSRQSYIILKTN